MDNNGSEELRVDEEGRKPCGGEIDTYDGEYECEKKGVCLHET